jgi:hypothetical protein
MDPEQMATRATAEVRIFEDVNVMRLICPLGRKILSF